MSENGSRQVGWQVGRDAGGRATPGERMTARSPLDSASPPGHGEIRDDAGGEGKFIRG